MFDDGWSRYIFGAADKYQKLPRAVSRDRKVADRKSLMMVLANYATILLLLLCFPSIHGTTCPKIESLALSSGYAMIHPNKKFQSGNVTRLIADSEMFCYHLCLNECLCYFANYHDIRGKKKYENCELVKYSSCSNKSGVTSIEAVGWRGIHLGRVCSVSSYVFYGGQQLPRQNQSFMAKFQFPQLPLNQFSRQKIQFS